MKTLFRKLKISQKLLILSAAFSLPIAVLLYFVITGYNHDIYFTQKEIYGNKLLEPLTDALIDIEKHQKYSMLYHAIRDDEKIKHKLSMDALTSEMDLINSKIKESFSKLIGANEKYGSHINTLATDLQLIGEQEIVPETISKKWFELSENWKNIDQEAANTKYDDIGENITSLIKYIGNKSNLILDPDLDSYYLMDISLLIMPVMQMELNDLMLKSSLIGLRDSLTKQDILSLVYISGSIQDDYRKRISSALDVAITEDKNYYEQSSSLQKELPEAHSKYEKELDLFFEILDILINEQSKINFDKLLTSTESVMDSGSIFWSKVFDELDILLEQRIDDHRYKRLISVMISAIALIFAVVMVLYISRSITQPLKALERIARNVAQGNIKQAIQDVQDSKAQNLKLKNSEELQKMDPNDELLIVFCAIERMTANLDSLLNQVQLSGREVSDSANSISESARDLESTIAQQVSSTNEVNATSKEISSTAKDLAQTMGKVSEMVTNASDLAFSGISNLTDIKSIMLELKNETGEISDKLELINSKTENISAIITKITKVANRTNLLSLNAAIEAEKAGEHGTGFSVVAREIRLLADETSVAALDIEEMIIETQKAVRDGVVAVESYTEKTNRSSSTIASISEEMSGLISHINDLVPKFNSVNEGMQIQSEGADQIKEAMEQLNESARYTKDALMKFRRITDVLSETLGNMNNELSKFQI
jgi:methyl-accepting chemotaxis protein